MSNDIKTLPFDLPFQEAIIGHCATNPSFAMICQAKVKCDWFPDFRLAKLWSVFEKFFQKHKRVPTFAEWHGGSEIALETEIEKRSLQNTLTGCKARAEEFGLDVVRGRMTDWYRAQIFMSGVQKANGLYNSGKHKDAYETLTQETVRMNNENFEEKREMDFGDALNILEKNVKSYEDACTTGLDILDKSMSIDQTKKGSLYKGDMTLLMAPSGAGKTTFMITVAVANALDHKNVLFLSHEGNSGDLFEKILCNTLRVTKSELLSSLHTEEGRKKIANISSILKKNLVYLPYTKAGLMVEEVTSSINRKQDEWAATHGGKGFDLIIDDYPALMGTQTGSKGNLQKRHSDGYIYGQFMAVAAEIGAHALLAIQTNRNASRDNKKGDRLLDTEDVSESWDTVCKASNVIVINRDLKAVQQNYVQLLVAKSRSTKTGAVIVANSDYARACSHSNHLKASRHFAGDLLSDQVVRLINDYHDKEIPANIVKEISASAKEEKCA